MSKSKRKDWTGQKYGKLTFVRPTGTTDSSRHAIWELICDCGNTHIASCHNVKKGSVSSCGCKNGQNTRKYTPIETTARHVWHGAYKDCDFDTFYTMSQLPCFYCGRAPFKTFNLGVTKRKHGIPVSEIQIKEGGFTYNGLDRIDSSKGHTIGNIVPCCWTCNHSKGSMTLEEFILHIERMYAHTQQLRETLTSATKVALDGSM